MNRHRTQLGILLLSILMSAALSVGLLALTGPASAMAKPAKVSVVHGIPGVSVNVCVDGSSVADNFNYGNTITGAELPAGSHDVKLVAAGDPCSNTAILSDTYNLSAGANYTIVANLDGSGSPNLKAFVNKVSKVAEGNARLTIRHTANAPAVNVYANGGLLIGGTNYVWGESKTFTVPAGSYKAKVTLPSSTSAVIGPAKLMLKQGHAYQVYAVGNGGTYSLAVIDLKVGMR